MTSVELPTRERRREFPRTGAEILSHPLRVRMLEIANELDVSAVSFVRGGYARSLLDHLEEGIAVSQVSYHFRKLARAGCIEAVRRQVRRGAVENVYRGTARAYFGDEEWKALDQERRQEISGVVLQGLMARAESALLEETFDSRDDRWLVWTQMMLDEEGWEQLCALCHEMMDGVERVRDESKERLGSAAARREASPITWGMLAFESPRL